jgi:hypothetical protein
MGMRASAGSVVVAEPTCGAGALVGLPLSPHLFPVQGAAMGSDAFLAVKMAAFAAGMKAKAGDLARDDIDQLRDLVERDLDPEDQNARAITAFVVDFGVHFRDPVKLAEIGADLCRHVDAMNVPQPPDLERRDIYG